MLSPRQSSNLVALYFSFNRVKVPTMLHKLKMLKMRPGSISNIVFKLPREKVELLPLTLLFTGVQLWAHTRMEPIMKESAAVTVNVPSRDAPASVPVYCLLLISHLCFILKFQTKRTVQRIMDIMDTPSTQPGSHCAISASACILVPFIYQVCPGLLIRSFLGLCITCSSLKYTIFRGSS